MLFKLTFFCVLIVLGDYYLESPRNKKKTFKFLTTDDRRLKSAHVIVVRSNQQPHFGWTHPEHWLSGLSDNQESVDPSNEH